MEELIRGQLVQKELLEKFVTNYTKDGKDRRTCSYYLKRLKELDNLWAQARENHREILIRKMSNPEEVRGKKFPYLDDDIFSKMESHFMDSYAVIEERFKSEYPPVESVKPVENGEVKVVQARNEGSIKLPKISLEKFSGDYQKWPTFFDLFNTLVHDNNSLAAVQKLQYLKLHLTGEAEHLLRHFKVTGDNYKDAWNLLKDRYNNKRILVHTHLKILLGQGALANESARGIKNLLDTTTECLQAIKNLGVSIKEWDVIIVHITVQKLSSETHALWEQSVAKTRELPTWAELQEFLEARFRALEAVGSKGSSPGNRGNRSSVMKPSGSAQTFHSSYKLSCSVCNGAHNLRQCSQFSAMEFAKKLEIVKNKRLCINCLSFGHLLVKCPSSQSCSYCNRRHHTLLHRKPNESFQSAGITNQSTNSRSEVNSSQVTLPSQVDSQSSMSAASPSFVPQGNNLASFFANKIPENAEVLLTTALVRVVAPSGKEQILRALIDQGSQATFVTEAAIQSLNLHKEPIQASVVGVGQTNAGQVSAKVQLVLRPLNNSNISINVSGLVLKRLTNHLPPRRISIQNWEHIRGLELADPLYYKPGKIDLLLGADVYSNIIQGGLVKGDIGSPIAQETIFGWVLSGNVTNSSHETIIVKNFHVLAELDHQLKKFWELEEINPERAVSEEEQKIEDNFKANCKRLENGRYEVALPFDEAKLNLLGESRNRAVSRLIQMERQLNQKPQMHVDYMECLREYVDLEHMEAITEVRSTRNELQPFKYCYLPHHAVIKQDSTTTRLRVVFDASQKTSSGISLNDTLLNGPTIQDNLASLLLRWRNYRIAFTSDIEKMYRQVRVKPEHAEFQRVVWRDSMDKPIQDYKLLTVTFGTKSAPYLATRVLMQLAQDEMATHPIGAKAVLTEFYVDDLLSGDDNLESASEKQDQLIKVLRSGGFNLRKWASNHPNLLANIPEENREMKVKLNLTGVEQVKTLGLYWDPVKDELCYSLKLNEEQSEYTKRTVLSEAARLFDPLGWAAPIIVIAKIFIQKLWLAKLEWDDEIPCTIKEEWLRFRRSMVMLETIRLPRWNKFSESNLDVEIHGFCDSSMSAYAAAVYMCVIDSAGNRMANLLAAKTKVAPIKTVSLPRLELCGAALLAKLLRWVLNSLKLSNVSLFSWTDSEIVLAWLKGHPSR